MFKFTHMTQRLIINKFLRQCRSKHSFTRKSTRNKTWPMSPKSTKVGVGVSSCFVTGTMIYQSYKHGLFQSFIPTVHSISEDQSKRKQFNFISDAIKTAAPSVVHIESQGTTLILERHSGQMNRSSNASGFIVREDGLILTNAHAVANNRNVTVKLHNGETYEGRVQAVDPVSDLATVKINKSNLPCLKIGNSKDLQAGEWVIAMGSPLRLTNTVTAGIVSSTRRTCRELGINTDIDYIQTDADITFGNSGGPLINLDGEVIGINTMKMTAGISFAIPIEYAETFLKKTDAMLEQKGEKGKIQEWFSFKSEKPQRRYIGITMLNLSPDLVNELRRTVANFPNTDYGVLVHSLVVDSPAYKAGLHPGDIIIKVNGTIVKSATDLSNAINKHDSLHITILRAKSTLQLTVIPEAQ